MCDVGVDVDTISGRVIGHTEVHRFADVPEPDIIAPADVVGGERCLLAVNVECLGGGTSSEIVRRLGGWATQCESSQNPDPHKDGFPFSVHDDSSFDFCDLGNQQQCRRTMGKGFEHDIAIR